MSRSDAINTNRQDLLNEAADWLTPLDTGQLDSEEHQALQAWCKTSDEHQRVWQAACELNRQFSLIPNGLAKPVLGRNRVNRRTVIKSLVGAGLLLPLSWTMARNKPWQPLLADHHNGIGIRRNLTLADSRI